MKLGIYKKMGLDEQPVLLELRTDGDNIDVVIVDGDGERFSYLVSFRPDGTLYRYKSVPKELGFKTNTRGVIHTVEEK